MQHFNDAEITVGLFLIVGIVLLFTISYALDNLRLMNNREKKIYEERLKKKEADEQTKNTES